MYEYSELDSSLGSLGLKTSEKEFQPEFIIIGAQKCGTTSLYQYLIQHPQIVPATQKEVHFFDLNFDKGVDWYKGQFPAFERDNAIAGEASPYYIFHPLVPQRVYQLFPQVKLIVLLRNPVARTISHYYHEVRLGYEHLSLEEAIAKEPVRLQGEIEKMHKCETYYSFNHQHYTYLSRGIYIAQLIPWMNLFPKQQFLILKSQDLYNKPNIIFERVLEFLNIPKYQLSEYGKYNASDSPYPQINKEIYARLTAYFQPHNRRLEEFLGINFEWQ